MKNKKHKLLEAFTQKAREVDEMRNELRRLDVTWQEYADYGATTQAVVAYVSDHKYKVHLKDARVVIQEYVAERKAALVHQLVAILKQGK